ncbi:MAG: DUF418 domain-containing protein [Prevotella sp.]|nr:DUF418 domain-containing protein [Prevotella sp.]
MTTGPTTERQRHQILDALRGFALMGIALANYPEFSLWTFLPAEAQAAMPTAAADRLVRLLHYLLVDGKFYTIFSLLFGVGFSLILSRHGSRLFLRRMLILFCIGFLHLMFLWSGDILLLYAVGGLLLPLFIRLTDRALLYAALLLIFIPVGLDALTEFAGIDFAAPFYAAWWQHATAEGITEENFASWLRDAHTYPQMFAFLVQGAYERMWEFVEGHRLPKVLGLFILGYLVGKHRLYVRLEELPLRRLLRCSLLVGASTSLLYAWSAVSGRPWGLTAHSLLYAVSVIPLAFAYISAFALVFVRVNAFRKIFSMLAAPGRMALSNYIGQTLIGILLFYGLGFGLGTTFGLIHVVLTAFAVFLLQILLSRLWLRYFRFGILEWLWRMLTYGRYFPIRR